MNRNKHSIKKSGDRDSKPVDSDIPKSEEFSFPVKSDGHIHNGFVLSVGDKITPKNLAQEKFLRDNNII